MKLKVEFSCKCHMKWTHQMLSLLWGSTSSQSPDTHLRNRTCRGCWQQCRSCMCMSNVDHFCEKRSTNDSIVSYSLSSNYKYVVQCSLLVEHWVGSMAAYCMELEAHNILLAVHQDYPLPTPTLYSYAFIISINFLTAQRGLFPYLTIFLMLT